MNKTRRKNKSGKNLLWLVILLSLLLIYPAYYQLWYHSTQVNSNIYSLNKILVAHLSDVWTTKFSPDGSAVASHRL